MRLYALCDQDMLDAKGVSVEAFIEIAKKHGAEIIQYRNKNASMAYIKQKLILIRKIYEGFLIVNDAYELIEFCDGVHMGQEDLKAIDADINKAVAVLRSVVDEDKIIGISTHSEIEVDIANNLDINYIGLGAYRNTTTKKDISGILGSKLDAIASKSKHYVAAIGGVRLDDEFEHVRYNVIGSGLIQ